MELNILGGDNAKLQVNDAIFARAYNEALIHQAVVAYQANARVDTAVQKTRSQVRGGGAKPWRQKGTGRARAGTIRGPIWRGGGVTFASGLRNYKQKVNRKMHRAALCSVLSELQRLERLYIIEQLVCETPKTKALLTQLQQLALKDVLIVVAEMNQNLRLAARNVAQIRVIDVYHVDVVNLLKYKNILIEVAAIKQLEEQLA